VERGGGGESDARNDLDRSALLVHRAGLLFLLLLLPSSLI
jgi:hypothetical protein